MILFKLQSVYFLIKSSGTPLFCESHYSLPIRTFTQCIGGEFDRHLGGCSLWFYHNYTLKLQNITMPNLLATQSPNMHLLVLSLLLIQLSSKLHLQSYTYQVIFDFIYYGLWIHKSDNLYCFGSEWINFSINSVLFSILLFFR